LIVPLAAAVLKPRPQRIAAKENQRDAVEMMALLFILMGWGA
jgi:hypothetical protein